MTTEFCPTINSIRLPRTAHTHIDYSREASPGKKKHPRSISVESPCCQREYRVVSPLLASVRPTVHTMIFKFLGVFGNRTQISNT